MVTILCPGMVKSMINRMHIYSIKIISHKQAKPFVKVIKHRSTSAENERQ